MGSDPSARRGCRIQRRPESGPGPELERHVQKLDAPSRRGTSRRFSANSTKSSAVAAEIEQLASSLPQDLSALERLTPENRARREMLLVRLMELATWRARSTLPAEPLMAGIGRLRELTERPSCRRSFRAAAWQRSSRHRPAHSHGRVLRDVGIELAARDERRASQTGTVDVVAQGRRGPVRLSRVRSCAWSCGCPGGGRAIAHVEIGSGDVL